MKHVHLLAGACFFLFLSIPIHGEALPDIEEYGVLTQPATFWIGTPEKSGAMAFLRIPEGTKVKILSEEGQYYRVNHKDLIGYVDSKVIKKITPGYVEKAPPPASSPAPTQKTTVRPIKASGPGYYFITERTSLRNGPDSDAAVLLRLPEYGRVKVLETSGKYWWKVTYKGTTGWAKAARLQKE